MMGIIVMPKRAISIFLSYIFMLGFLTSCTYSVSVVHTEGTASDVIDETQKSDPNINPNISIPLLK